MADGRYESVSTFILPDEYQRQAAEARRRRRMAEMLAQQTYEPGDISAPIPAAAPLVQGLQAFLTARAQRKADEAEEAAKGTASREARQYLKALTEAPDTTTDAVQPETKPTATVTMPQFEGGRITSPAGIEMGAPAPMVAPQIQLSRYNLTPGQRRAAALEGMLISENPMVQKIAGAIYPTLAPPKPEIGAVNPSDFTPESLRDYYRTGDFGVLKTKEQAPSTAGLSSLSKMISEREARIARNPNDPNIAILSDAIKKEIAPARGTTVNVTNRYGAPIPAVDAQGNPVFIQPSQTGGPPSVMTGYTPAPPSLNEGQANAAGFATRIQSALPDLNVLPPSRKAVISQELPLGIGAGQLSPQDQKFFRAEQDFISAVLRKESGAAISSSEYEGARKQYIPQPGDGPAVLEQKRIARENALDNMARSAGPGYRLPKKTTKRRTASGVEYEVEE